MKLSLLLLFACSSTAITSHPFSVKKIAFDSKKRVLFLPFFNDSPFGGEELARQFSFDLFQQLHKSDVNVTLSEKYHSKDIFAAHTPNYASIVDALAAEGYHLLMLGKISDFKMRENIAEYGLLRHSKFLGEMIVDVKIFHLVRGAEIYAHQFKEVMEDVRYLYFFSPESYKDTRQKVFLNMGKVMSEEIAPQLLTTIASVEWMGKIIKIMGDKYYIDAGKRSNIYIGDILQVIAPGERIIDPQSGAVLGLTKGEVKATLEVIDYSGEDRAVAILYSGGMVSEGDIVQQYDN